MKIILLIFLIFLSACIAKEYNSDKIYNDSTNIEISVVNSIDYNKYEQRTKIYLLNKGKLIHIFNNEKDYKIRKWREKEGGGNLICDFDMINCNILSIGQNDNAYLYMIHPKKADTLFLGLFWQRDSLGTDEIKFLKNSDGEWQYHSIKKGLRGYILNKSRKEYNNCPSSLE